LSLEIKTNWFFMRLFRWALTLVGLSVTIAGSSPLKAASEEFKAGVGRVDITPREPVFLGGYAARTEPFKGVAQRIFVKALALQDGSSQITLFVTADTIGTPRWFNDQLANRIERELKIPRERFLFGCSHSHSTPAIKNALEIAYGLTGDKAAAVEKYSNDFVTMSFEAARSALTNLEPVKLSFGRGEAHFAANRRQFVKSGVNIGVNPTGLVDNDVPVLRVEKTNGTIKAVLLGYACHCTTLGANDDVSGDWAGYAQATLENAYPGATALFLTGCGADANPSPRNSPILVNQHGLALAGAVARVLNEPMTPLNGPIHAAFSRVDLPLGPIPPKEDFLVRLTNSNPALVRSGKHFLSMLDRGEAIPTSYPCPVQVFRFGNELTLVGIGGEVVVDYSFRLRRELSGERVWTAGYCNDVFAYVPSVRVLVEGGYEADSSMIYYGFPTRFAPELEDLLVQQVIELARQTRKQ
jgi:neutral ceramidase